MPLQQKLDIQINLVLLPSGEHGMQVDIGAMMTTFVLPKAAMKDLCKSFAEVCGMRVIELADSPIILPEGKA